MMYLTYVTQERDVISFDNFYKTFFADQTKTICVIA